MKWLVVGLGNPGEKYQTTRHNVGFMMIDRLVMEASAGWQFNQTFQSEVAKAGEMFYAKPQTFMNRSGEAVGRVARYFQIPPNQVVVIHDDLDIAVGAIKAGLGKGPKVHHGVQSVEEVMGTPNFWRIRVGIENRSEEERKYYPGEKYVLLPFTVSERELIQTLDLKVQDKLEEIVRNGR